MYSNYKDSVTFSDTIGGVAVSEKGTLELKNSWDANIGLTLQAKTNGVILYGGPFAYMTRAKAVEKIAGTIAGFPFSGSGSENIKEKSNFGGFLGF